MADQWYMARDGQTFGPYPFDQLRQLVAEGRIAPSDLVWKDGMPDWIPCARVQGLVALGGKLPSATRSGKTDEFSFLDASSDRDRDVNPYRAPRAADAPKRSTKSMRYADYFPRVVACIIDGLICGVVGSGVQAALMFALTGAPFLRGRVVRPNEMFAAMIAFLAIVVLQICYYVFLEASTWQGTLGKQAMGIRVTDLRGQQISVGRAFGRYFAKAITGLTFGIGFLTPLFTERRQTLHDMISECLALER